MFLFSAVCQTGDEKGTLFVIPMDMGTILLATPGEPDLAYIFILGGTQMKKIIALLLACMMVLGLFAGCGAKEEPKENQGC